MDIYEYVHPDDVEKVLSISVIAMKAGDMVDFFPDKLMRFSIDYRILNAQGKYIRIVRQTTMLEKTGDNKLYTSLAHCFDISNYKKEGEIEFSWDGVGKDVFYDLLRKEWPVSFQKNNSSLTYREDQIYNLCLKGFSSKQISDKLCISIHTINTHRKNIKKKLKQF